MDGIGYWLATALSTLLGVVGIRMEETPDYKVLRTDGRLEIREYGPQLVVETRVERPMEQATGEAFNRLAGYIFGKNRAQQKVAMTAPVTMEASSSRVAMTAPVTMEAVGEATVMRFVVPSKYTRENVPQPTDERVSVRELPAQTVAVIRYSGRNTPECSSEMERELRTWLAAAGYEATGIARIAGYDSPFSLPFVRRNEVMIPVGPDPG